MVVDDDVWPISGPHQASSWQATAAMDGISVAPIAPAGDASVGRVVYGDEPVVDGSVLDASVLFLPSSPVKDEEAGVGM